MRAGDLNRKITIKKLGVLKDEWDTPIPGSENWSILRKAHANIKTLSGLSTIKADAQTAVAKASIRVRYCTDISPGMRAFHAETVFDIKEVKQDFAGREFTDLVCEVIHGTGP